MLAGAGVFVASRAAAAGDAESAVTPDVALAALAAGNDRYVAGRATHPNLGPDRRRTVAASQHPFATILACADRSRPP